MRSILSLLACVAQLTTSAVSAAPVDGPRPAGRAVAHSLVDAATIADAFARMGRPLSEADRGELRATLREELARFADAQSLYASADGSAPDASSRWRHLVCAGGEVVVLLIFAFRRSVCLDLGSGQSYSLRVPLPALGIGPGGQWFAGVAGGVDYIAVRTFEGRSLAGIYNGLSWTGAYGFVGGGLGLYVRPEGAAGILNRLELQSSSGFRALHQLSEALVQRSSDHLVLTSYRLGGIVLFTGQPLELVNLGRVW